MPMVQRQRAAIGVKPPPRKGAAQQQRKRPPASLHSPDAAQQGDACLVTRIHTHQPHVPAPWTEHIPCYQQGFSKQESGQLQQGNAHATAGTHASTPTQLPRPHCSARRRFKLRCRVSTGGPAICIPPAASASLPAAASAPAPSATPSCSMLGGLLRTAPAPPSTGSGRSVLPPPAPAPPRDDSPMAEWA
jgi:hypothetical protein